MEFFVDIDDTIAEHNTPLLIARCMTAFDLKIEETDLRGLDWPSFLQVPETQRSRQQVGEQAWTWRLRCISLDPDAQRQMLPLPGAVVSTHQLATLGTLRYCTCRKTLFNDEWDRRMVQATRDWLTAQGFPNPTEVLFCTAPVEKLGAIANVIQQTQEPAVLIDDAYTQLLADGEKLSDEERPHLARWLIVGAFGAACAPASSAFRCVALPEWAETKAFLEQVGVLAWSRTTETEQKMGIAKTRVGEHERGSSFL